VELLNDLFTRFDLAAQELSIEKIKTIGDAYMAVCGLPEFVTTTASE
jgi:class 3 adenylate cyclase